MTITPRISSWRGHLLAVGAVLVAVMGLAGCSGGRGEEGVVSVGGPTSASRSVDREQQVDEYRACLEQHDVPLLDYPTEEGLPQVDKTRVSAEKVSSALEACRAHLPDGGDAVRPMTEDVEAWRQYAACLREHGVPDYPDPDPRSGEPRMNDQQARQIKEDPDLSAAQQACQSELPSSAGGKGTVGG
jgi:hypothetical protein